ncbi:MAG: rhomboid family intramembrane serine protease [Paludibacter sp.]|jgi:membrane associated rhomboid family serine protease|nr:rhomboid family intramembrane serine protease [Paludibacter sp.]
MSFERPSFWQSIPPAVRNLLAINTILWLATDFSQPLLHKLGINISLTDVLGMHYWQAQKFQIWQMLTYMFMHGGFFHLFFNMLALYMFGSPLEYRLGTKRFLLYYTVAGIGAGIIQQVFWSIDFHSFIVHYNNVLQEFPNDVVEILAHFNSQLNLPITVGASGSVFGLLLAFGWLFPQTELFFMFIPVPIKARWAVAIYAGLELFFGVANFSFDNVAHYAHLGGMLFGLLLILWWKKQGKWQ